MTYAYANQFTVAGNLDITAPPQGIAVAIIILNTGLLTTRVTLLDAGNGETLFFDLVSTAGIVLDFVDADLVQNISSSVATTLSIALYEQRLPRRKEE